MADHSNDNDGNADKASSSLSASKNSDAQLSTDLGATFDAFATRIQKKKQELKVATSQAEQDRKFRQSLILNSMMSIRKSLTRVTQIDLGERCFLTLHADDWLGWPRLLIKLNDTEQTLQNLPAMQVVAHDRFGKASLEIKVAEQLNEKLALIESRDREKLAPTLKRCVRIYLDLVEELIVRAEAQEIHAPVPKVKEEEIPEATASADVSLSGDIFVDDNFAADYLEKLPSLEDIEDLPLINSKLALD